MVTGEKSHDVAGDVGTNAYVLTSWFVRFSSKSKVCVQGILSRLEHSEPWNSSSIVNRLDSQTLRSKTGHIYRLKGDMNVSEAAEKGFPHQLISRFQYGFPRTWKHLIAKHCQVRIRSSVDVSGWILSKELQPSNVTCPSDQHPVDAVSLPRTRPDLVPRRVFRRDKRAAAESDGVPPASTDPLQKMRSPGSVVSAADTSCAIPTTRRPKGKVGRPFKKKKQQSEKHPKFPPVSLSVAPLPVAESTSAAGAAKRRRKLFIEMPAADSRSAEQFRRTTAVALVADVNSVHDDAESETIQERGTEVAHTYDRPASIVSEEKKGCSGRPPLETAQLPRKGCKANVAPSELSGGRHKREGASSEMPRVYYLRGMTETQLLLAGHEGAAAGVRSREATAKVSKRDPKKQRPQDTERRGRVMPAEAARTGDNDTKTGCKVHVAITAQPGTLRFRQQVRDLLHSSCWEDDGDDFMAHTPFRTIRRLKGLDGFNLDGDFGADDVSSKTPLPGAPSILPTSTKKTPSRRTGVSPFFLEVPKNWRQVDKQIIGHKTKHRGKVSARKQDESSSSSAKDKIRHSDLAQKPKVTLDNKNNLSFGLDPLTIDDSVTGDEADYYFSDGDTH